MKNYYLLLSAFAIFCLGIALTYIVKYKLHTHSPDDAVAELLMEWQNPVVVRKINVLSGNEFDLQLQDGSNVRAILDIKATPEARKVLLDLLNRSTNPRMVAKHKVGDSWVVKLYVTSQNTNQEAVELEIGQWLTDKKLTYR